MQVYTFTSYYNYENPNSKRYGIRLLLVAYFTKSMYFSLIFLLFQFFVNMCLTYFRNLWILVKNIHKLKLDQIFTQDLQGSKTPAFNTESPLHKNVNICPKKYVKNHLCFSLFLAIDSFGISTGDI